MRHSGIDMMIPAPLLKMAGDSDKLRHAQTVGVQQAGIKESWGEPVHSCMHAQFYYHAPVGLTTSMGSQRHARA